MKPTPTWPLVPLPGQPSGTPWPTESWTRADPADVGAHGGELDSLLDDLIGATAGSPLGLTYGAAVVASGRLVAERYGRRPVPDLRGLGDDPLLEDVTPETPLLSWSMAKSITSLAVGAAVSDGAIRLDDPVGDPRWHGADDPRAAITWADLLMMRPGLSWTEEYYELEADALPDVITMLYGPQSADMAAFAADMDLVAPPGSAEAYVYSSGTTNIVAAALQRVLGLDASSMDVYLRSRIFEPIGMRSTTATYDDAGTFIGSSYVHATLTDWARFGLLALRGGTWDGDALVPAGWMDWSRTPRSWDDPVFHGAHWWGWDDGETPFGAHGFEGQRVIAFPARDVVVVRLGRSPADAAPELNRHISRIARCFPTR